MAESKRDRIQDTVELIMQEYGPDGHTDGSHTITDYIMALLEGSDNDFERELNRDVMNSRRLREKYRSVNK